jgi:hypothetical protein
MAERHRGDDEQPDEQPDLTTQERVARNEAIFREANEGIQEAASTYDVLERIPFICECADGNCRELLVLSMDEYEEIRGNPRHFLTAGGHVRAAQGAAEVVAERGRYTIVEKKGYAGDIVEGLDPRGGDA